jgi:hypothetical protein
MRNAHRDGAGKQTAVVERRVRKTSAAAAPVGSSLRSLLEELMSENLTTIDVGVPVPPFGTEAADQRQAFTDYTRAVARDLDAELAFLRSKLRMLETHPAFDQRSRSAAHNELMAQLGRREDLRRAAEEETGPLPGGVGYGMFYHQAFRTAFVRGTSFYYEIVCPTQPGGNVNTWLYLTATNRASRGVEAFVSYFGQNDTRFKVFDWAREDHWQTDVPFGNLSSYLRQAAAHGAVYQVLPVWNSSYEIGTNRWRNDVLLYNHAASRWDLIYRFDYGATSSEQTSGWVGSWGPIVETFQNAYSGTRPMGALNTMLISRDSGGAWGQWQLLGANDSFVRDDGQGYTTVFLDPNYSWTVVS